MTATTDITPFFWAFVEAVVQEDYDELQGNAAYQAMSTAVQTGNLHIHASALYDEGVYVTGDAYLFDDPMPLFEFVLAHTMGALHAKVKHAYQRIQGTCRILDLSDEMEALSTDGTAGIHRVLDQLSL